MQFGFNKKKQQKTPQSSTRKNSKNSKFKLIKFAKKHYQIIGIFLSAFSVIVALFGVIVGQGGVIPGIKDWVSSKPINSECISAKFDTSKYQAAEQAFFQEFSSKKVNLPPSLWQSDGKPISLGEMLIYQSRELINLRDALVEKRRANEKNQLFFIYGSAGVGKSSVVDYLKKIKSVAIVDVGSLRYNSVQKKKHHMTELVTDLKIGDIEISKMASLQDKSKKKFMQLLSDIADKNISKNSSIIIDGLDEIHPNSSLHILSLAREYIKTNPQKNIIFFGRGEAFRNYVDEYEDDIFYKPVYLQPILLNEPEILHWYIGQFLTYKSTKENVNYTQPVEELEKNIQEIEQKLNDSISKNPALRSYLQTAYPANVILKNLRYDIGQINELVFSDLIDRNSKTHNRPSRDNLRVWSLYEKALREAARSLSLEKRPDGTFTAIVKPTKMINIKHNGKCYSVGLADLLNRSGIANLNPFNQKQLEYTFQPLTIQKLLADAPVEL